MVKTGKEPNAAAARGGAAASTVATALKILTCFTHSAPEWTVKELARQLDLPYSTAYRYVSTLESCGFLMRERATGICRVGLPVIELGGVALHQLEVRVHGVSYLAHLADITGFSANLAVLYQGDVLHVAYELRSEVSQAYYPVLGRRATAHCTALGKAILADLPFDEVRRLIAVYGWRPYTPHSLRSFDDLQRDLAETRRRGYALDCFERSLESNCIAAPIRNRFGRAAGAISITIPKSRLDAVDLAALAQTVVEHAGMIAYHMGYNPLVSYH